MDESDMDDECGSNNVVPLTGVHVAAEIGARQRSNSLEEPSRSSGSSEFHSGEDEEYWSEAASSSDEFRLLRLLKMVKAEKGKTVIHSTMKL